MRIRREVNLKRPPGVAAFAARGEWIVVRRQVPAWVMDPEPYRPELVLLMDPVTGLVVNLNTFKPSEPIDGFAGWIADQVAGLPRHVDHRSLRTNDQKLASLLREKLAGDWDVVVAPTPEAEKALASLAASLSAPPGAGGHFADGATPEVVGRFFAAAAPVFRAAPWRAATDAQGAALSGVTITVTSVATAVATTVETDAVGRLMKPCLSMIGAAKDGGGG